ncbi:S-adenosyl-L-methionine-dependent methyltransferase [Coniophora puteana RWD-64-598 SS2]|uniref:S-adenosyl-L-methionine-dependent methyltransferase n=1 Tax=Coniophora puteana (strain RWD-64-598) TaxID=741705 RepID=A0A5M3MP13_CONPW|nr:S-adenosyl-L-methionine-dependent methyltransferase [Coniophora puteana RWD-64-598 SS2]EIW80787.1 S-adenosyl-L-methionine-dependent methyltransferase [Coniophora puteana RWD-64-598 SS2]
MSTNADVESLISLISSSARVAAAEWQRTGTDVPPLSEAVTHPIDTATDVVALQQALRTLEGACEHLTTLLSPPGSVIFRRTFNPDTHLLRIAVEHKVPDILAKHPNGLSLTELSKIVNVPELKLGQIMRGLATRHVFVEVNTDIFANNRLSHSIRSYLPNGLYALASRGLNETQSAGSNLYESLCDESCGPSFEAKDSPFMHMARKDGFEGNGVFGWLEANPARRENYAIAMIGMGYSCGGLNVLHAFPWQNYTSVCDIGGSVGTVSMPLARKYPHLRITIQDREEVTQHTIDHWASNYPEAVAENRAHFVPIDFLTGAPVEGCDLYYMRFILHDWPQSDAQIIVNNVRKAMSPKSRLLIHDYMITPLDRKSGLVEAREHGIEPAPEPLLPNYGAGRARAHCMDIGMLLQYNAKERSLTEFLELATNAGLKFEKHWDLAETSMLEFSIA